MTEIDCFGKMRGLGLRAAASVLLAAVILFAGAAPSSAQVYRWEDKDGNVHYSSKLPPGVKGTTKLGGPPISRYSSDKLTKSYGAAGAKRGGVDLKTEKIVPPKNGAARIKLEQGPLNIKHDDKQRVNECSVTVKNSGNEDAHRVIVSFAFEDGKLVPGRGPEGVPAGGQAVYSIAPEDLPIAVDAATKAIPPTPSVLIEHG